jgi:hypothetical protein
MKIILLLAAVVWTAACNRGAPRNDTARADSPRADPTAQASDECVRGEPEPVLTATGPAGARPRFERTGKLEATEDTRLNDTTALRITHGGCAHYVETYTFTVRGAVRDTADAKYWLARTADYLRALPAVEVKRSQLAEMAAALQKAAAGTPPYTYGDPIQASEMATVTSTVRRGGTARAVVIEVVYDVAL